LMNNQERKKSARVLDIHKRDFIMH
ncbi:unnamed protein product, partial [Oikopleura dioica]